MMEIPAPSQNPILLGHEEALRQVEEAYASGRMHHAWLIAGIEGIGKTTLAWHIAHYVLADGKNPMGKLNMQHPAARLVAGEAHPDLFILRRPVDDKTGEPKNEIPVEEARKLAPFLRKTATHGGWRVVILDEAHTLNRFGQNAILKIIEEPPEKCLILLTVTTAGVLLPTIRSRCRMLQLQPLPDTALRALFARYGADEGTEAERARIFKLSAGSVGFALKMIQTESLPLYDELLGILRGLPSLDMARLHVLADRMGRKADIECFKVITQLFTDLLRRAVKAQATGEAGDPEPADLANRLVGSPERAMELWEKTVKTLHLAESANLDRKLAFINAVTEVRRGC